MTLIKISLIFPLLHHLKRNKKCFVSITLYILSYFYFVYPMTREILKKKKKKKKFLDASFIERQSLLCKAGNR